MHPLTRQSRHALMVGQMSTLALLAAWQILAGPQRTDTLWHLPQGSYLILALMMLIGTFSCLSATVQSDSWTATAFELFGEVILLGPLWVYFVSVIGTARYPDTDIVTPVLAGLLIGLIGRIISISRDVTGVVKEHLAPPVGDLDLMTADHVDSVAAVIADQHGTSSLKQEFDALERMPRPRHATEEES